MFGIGFGELVLIALVVLVVYGPKRLPEVARKLGSAAHEARKMTAEFRAALTGENEPTKPDVEKPREP